MRVRTDFQNRIGEKRRRVESFNLKLGDTGELGKNMQEAKPA